MGFASCAPPAIALRVEARSRTCSVPYAPYRAVSASGRFSAPRIAHAGSAAAADVDADASAAVLAGAGGALSSRPLASTGTEPITVNSSANEAARRSMLLILAKLSAHYRAS